MMQFELFIVKARNEGPHFRTALLHPLKSNLEVVFALSAL